MTHYRIAYLEVNPAFLNWTLFSQCSMLESAKNIFVNCIDDIKRNYLWFR